MSESASAEVWLSELVTSITNRPCVVAFAPERTTSWFGGERHEPAHWRITIKGIDGVPHIDPARIELRDEEHIRRRVLDVLPKEAEALGKVRT